MPSLTDLTTDVHYTLGVNSQICHNFLKQELIKIQSHIGYELNLEDLPADVARELADNAQNRYEYSPAASKALSELDIANMADEAGVLVTREALEAWFEIEKKHENRKSTLDGAIHHAYETGVTFQDIESTTGIDRDHLIESIEDK